MGHFLHLLGMDNNVLCHLYMITLDFLTYFLSMKSPKFCTCSNHFRSKLRITNESRVSNLTMEVILR